MSLDVYLMSNITITKKNRGSGIFIRENGATKEITDEEWRERYPGREPVRSLSEDSTTNELYTANITHNLNKMAEAAGIYHHLWRPDELGITTARELIFPLSKGLGRLMSAPSVYKEFNPDNGWGDYDGLCEFVFNYIKACQQYPAAKVEVSR